MRVEFAGGKKVKKNKKRGQDSQLNDMLEWQNKQYTPWHYYQKGKTIPGIAGEGNLKVNAIVHTIGGIIAISGSIIALVSGFILNDYDGTIVFLLIIGMCVWEITVHWNKYNGQKVFIEMKREKQKRQRKKWKKRP